MYYRKERGRKRRLEGSTRDEQPDRRFESIVDFLGRFVRELNDLALEGAFVLVEGKRDATALERLGYNGPIVTKALVHSKRSVDGLGSFDQAIILTDLDREGRRLASTYLKFFEQRGIRASLTQRRRLLKASQGIFLHVENLGRFASPGLDRAGDLALGQDSPVRIGG